VPRFDPAAAGSGPLVRGFSAGGGFIVDGVPHRALLLTPERATGWEAPALPSLSETDVEAALDVAPEFLLLGTGPMLARPPLAFVRALEARGVGVEIMDSRAAARTWAVLRAEERWISAALLPLQSA
jgi:uncharacterized protein